MQIGLQILRNRNQPADTSLLSKAQWYLGNPPNKLAQPIPQWIRIYTGEEAEWVRQFLEDIQLWSKPVPAICIHYNQVTIYKAQNFVYTGKSRHIRYRHNIVRRHSTARQLLLNGVIFIDFVLSKDKVADPFTKSLSGERIDCELRGMRLKA